MSYQPAPSSSNTTSQHRSRQRRTRKYQLPMANENELAPLTEDDDVFIALAAIDLMQRLEDEPL